MESVISATVGELWSAKTVNECESCEGSGKVHLVGFGLVDCVECEGTGELD